MRFVTILFGMFFLLIHWQCRPDQKVSVFGIEIGSQPTGRDNLCYRWTEVILDATARDTERFKPRPTVTSRCLALIYIAMHDAWSRYTTHTKPIYATGIDTRPESEHTLSHQEMAISYAAYTALREYYFADSLLFDSFMQVLQFPVTPAESDRTSPAWIGIASARAVIEARRDDGSNQYGHPEGNDTTMYGDHTGYVPVNTADLSTDIMRWQPKYFIGQNGDRFAPACLTPHWGNVEPVALERADMFRSPPPPSLGSDQLQKEVEEVVRLQAALTDEQKALVEFMRDGPVSVQQAGHWLIFAQNVSVRDDHTLEEDIRMYTLVEITAMDAFIACWDTKMHYDYARPYALVHHYMADKTIRGWAGPERGMTEMKGREWRPYSPDSFLCPPFPAYVSGHSTVSGACSEILALVTGSDVFGEKMVLVAGALTEPNHTGDTITIEMPTFSKTADIAGWSRVLGGYHIQSDNTEGLILGRKVGHEVWTWYQQNILTK